MSSLNVGRNIYLEYYIIQGIKINLNFLYIELLAVANAVDDGTGDLALVGCSNSVQAKISIPSISSVGTPLPKPSGIAVGVLKDLLEQKTISEQVVVPANLIIHESCGCQEKIVIQAGEFARSDSKKTSTSFMEYGL